MTVYNKPLINIISNITWSPQAVIFHPFTSAFRKNLHL